MINPEELRGETILITTLIVPQNHYYSYFYYMKSRLLLLGFCLWSFGAMAQTFFCPPCDADCDTLVFDEPGFCPHCGMGLQEDLFRSILADSTLQPFVTEAEESGESREVISWISDVYGPRLLGTENYWQALNWCRDKLQSWGVEQVSFHDFDRQHRTWNLEGFQVEMVAPTYAPLLAYPAAFTGATAGMVEGELVYLNHWQDIYALKGELRGKVVLLGDTYRPVSSSTRPLTRRFTAEELAEAEANPDPNHRVIGYLSRRSINRAIQGRQEQRERMEPFFVFAKEEGVLALVEASNFPYGILHADGNSHFPSYVYADDIQPPPGLVLANEHFGRLKRLLDLGISPRLRLEIDASFTTQPEYQQNLLAELTGQDPELAEESVIIGSHFDSWHAGTGAVDNASGVAVMMEAIRLLKALDLPMKRTVKLALWGGEEQVFAGSFAYVQDFVGNINNGDLAAEAERISAYFNLDNGSGRIRGIYTMGNTAAHTELAEWLDPFPASNTLTMQYANQTDHELFDRLNVPAFQFIQDPLDYLSIVHHTNMDVPEYVDFQDVSYNAVVLAWLVYQAANAPEQLPRKRFNSPKASRLGETVFQLPGYPDAKEVQIIGTFNNWNLFGTPLYRTHEGWACQLPLEAGEYLYKFYVDGDFIADPATPKSDLLSDGKGHGGLTRLVVE